MHDNAKILPLTIAIVLIVTVLFIPHPLFGILLVLDLAALIILLSFERLWGGLEFLITALSVIALFFALLALSAPAGLSVTLLAIVLAIALFATIVMVIFHEAQPVELGEPDETRLVAIEGSSVYHRPDCMTLARSPSRARRVFRTPHQAEVAGLKPCRACRPKG